MVVVNYFRTQLPETEEIARQMKTDLNSESTGLHEKDLIEYQEEVYFTTEDVLRIETPVTLTAKDLQIESIEYEEVLIKKTLRNPIPFEYAVECVAKNTEAI